MTYLNIKSVNTDHAFIVAVETASCTVVYEAGQGPTARACIGVTEDPVADYALPEIREEVAFDAFEGSNRIVMADPCATPETVAAVLEGIELMFRSMLLRPCDRDILSALQASLR